MDAKWHTYWRNSGASGMPTKISWELPKGITAGEIQWPVPEKLPDADLTTYIYKDEVVLLVPLKLGADLPPGPVQLKAQVSWLECDVSCIPGKATLEAALNIGSESKPSKDSALLESWQKKLPEKGESLHAIAWWKSSATGDVRPLLVEWDSAKAASDADFFPDASDQFEVQPAERLPADAGKIRLTANVKKLEGSWPTEVSGVLVQKSGDQRLAHDVRLPVRDSGPTSATASTVGSTGVSALPAPSLWKMLLYAFIGGLILNIMPCVLPVIALKILGFVGQARDEPGRVRALGLIYALGVLVSFLALAAIVIGVKAAGHRAGWGMQFGNPEFLVVLTVLVTLVALNLFGLFEVNLSGQVMGAAGTLASRHGAGGAFFNGVLATILATPCTAPFLGAALGFAFAQAAPLIVVFFLTVGAGLALPYVVLSWQPAWLKFLPKPGAWMEKFKIAMGFPMLATAIWLFSLLPIHYGDRSWWLALFLVVVALAAWIFGEFAQRGRSRRGLAIVLAVLLLAGGYVKIVEGELRWRSPETGAATTTALQNDPQGIAWKPWSPEAVSAARAENRPVLVDFTAKWCLTCNTIVKPALESGSVQTKLRELNVVPMLGDYTRFPENITEELNRFGRAGVPLVLVYPSNANEPPLVLPEALTPGMIVSALDKAK
jgi:thiol:disulfide interchange protein DsbD